MFGHLNLTTQESMAFVLEEDDEDYPGCPIWAIVGKVLAPNNLHISMIKDALRPAWGNPKGLEFHLLGANRFLAKFRCKADKDCVKEGSPWTIRSDASVPAPNNASSKAHGKEGVGQDFSTPKQRKARANRAKIISSPDKHNLVDVSIAVAGSRKMTNITGQKRKVYLPKAQVQQNIDTSPLPMVLVSKKGHTSCISVRHDSG
ncbi:hypothetical protein D1007_49006 [Hordeum vulgare]|nr:hypothetical protein D1007_49006 [Hordeum vulgare]